MSFFELLQREHDALLDEMQQRLEADVFGPLGSYGEPYRPTWRDRVRSWPWRVRFAIGRPIHWLANRISPYGGEEDD